MVFPLFYNGRRNRGGGFLFSIAAGAPSINHLFFADDNLLFCNATLREVNELVMIFQVYENAPGQRINFTKSAICFSSSTSVEAKQQIQQLLDVPIVPCHERYLGLPMVAGKDKKINGWEGK